MAAPGAPRAPHAPADIRNIALVGHGGSGKTTLTERLLFASGATKRMGSVDEGNTVSDFTEEERHHKHSLTAACVHFDYEGHLVNVIDTPGLGDFLGHAVAAFAAVETIAVVVDAVRGIESSTRKVMSIAEQRKLPRMIIVNKIESPDADLEGIVENLREAFGPVCLPINLPAAGKSKVINVFEHDGSDGAGDQTDFSSVREAHKAIIEQIVELDEGLMGEYLEAGEKTGAMTPQRLHDVFEKALDNAHLIPIAFCSAKTGAGIDDLLHIFSSLLPSPLEGNPEPFLKRDAEGGPEHEWHATPDPAGKLLAHVFKVSTDPFVGKLAFFRVHQGTIRVKGEVFLNDQKKPLRIGHLFKCQGRDHVEVHEVGAGDIAAVSKLEEIHWDGVLHDSHELDSVHLDPLPLPRPMFGLAVELKNHADEAKFSTSMNKLAEEDPCLKMERIPATKQTVIRGLGELHLRVALERLKTNFNIDVLTSVPKTAYKETVTARAEGHHRHKKQTGGAGQFGEVFLNIEPIPADFTSESGDVGFDFVNATFGGSIPKQYIPAIEKGVRQVMHDGAVAGYPMTGIRVNITDGKYHAVDSKEIAFVTAGRKAFVDAVQKARPALLEPWVRVEITAPSKYMGDITSDIAGKRGRVQNTDMLGADLALVVALAPMSELQNYSNELKSMTGGQGTYTVEFSHEDHTPAHIMQEVVSAYKPKAEEE
jgi:elongation factor G